MPIRRSPRMGFDMEREAGMTRRLASPEMSDNPYWDPPSEAHPAPF
jgi:hypothetical protein